MTKETSKELKEIKSVLLYVNRDSLVDIFKSVSIGYIVAFDVERTHS